MSDLIGRYAVKRSLPKPIMVAPKPTSNPMVIATATYGATPAFTKGLLFFGMQNQSVAPATASVKMPDKKYAIRKSSEPYYREALFRKPLTRPATKNPTNNAKAITVGQCRRLGFFIVLHISPDLKGHAF
jgi:hypothetical protein